MKKAWLLLLVAVFFMTVVLSGCGGKDNSKQTNTKPTKKAADGELTVNKDLSGEITVWTWNMDPLTKSIPGFNKYYPNVKVKVINPDDMTNKVKTAIASGTGAPDVFQVEQGGMAAFNNLEGIEDLLLPPYNAGAYKADFTEGQWDQYTSLDGKKLIAFPWDLPPMVTWYRVDIMDENGFPSDPLELGNYMEDPENWLTIAQTLKAHDQYVSAQSEIIGMYTSNEGYFDHDLQYLRGGDDMVKALDLAKRVRQLDLEYKGFGVWDEKGTQAMESGKIAMTYAGSWFGFCCMEPKLKSSVGKWRATRLPFGLYRGAGGSALSISSQSKNKKAAWAFVEYCLATKEGSVFEIQTNNMPGYKPAWDLPEFKNVKYELLGGQPLMEFAAPLAEKVPPFNIRTPLDDKANKIFWDGINSALEKNTDSATAIKNIQTDVEEAVSLDKQKLLDSLAK